MAKYKALTGSSVKGLRSGKRHVKCQQPVQDQSLMMEKSWVMMMDWIDKEHKD